MAIHMNNGVALLLLFLQLAGSAVAAADSTFDEFIKTFDKRYDSAAEYETRRAIFQRNVDHLRSSSQSYKLGINAFTDMEPREVPRGYDHGMKLLLNNEPIMMRRDDLPLTLQPVADLPRHVDWRESGKITTPVKNQGHCGSCWAFASTAVLESHIALQTGRLYQFSTQELVSCAPNPLNCGGSGGCAGATAEIAFDLAMKRGLVEEWDFGYQSYHGATPNCSLSTMDDASSDAWTADSRSLRSYTAGVTPRQEDNTAKTRYQEAVATIAGYVKLPTNDYQTLMNVVAKLGPVAVSVACEPWIAYKSGVFYEPFNTTRSTDIDHLVVLEGYGTDETTGEDYWLVRNSWGPGWGEDGYIRLKRSATPECGLDTRPADGTACTKTKDGRSIHPEPVEICGNSGILYDASIPLGGYLL